MWLQRSESTHLLNQGALPLPSELLSVRLRNETATLHSETERTVGLPHSIATLAHYKVLIQRFYRLYRPLEDMLRGFDAWRAARIDLSAALQADRLAHDLAVLGISPLQLEDAPKASMPSLQNFGHVLGALYVLEGSKLGSQVILHHLTATLGNEIEGADTFFRGNGAQTFHSWKQFRVLLDAYGMEHPRETSSVIEGAKATFEAIRRWMQP